MGIILMGICEVQAIVVCNETLRQGANHSTALTFNNATPGWPLVEFKKVEYETGPS